MFTAVTTLSFVTIGVKDEQKGDDKVPVRAIVDKERQIDLLKLHKYCGSIGADGIGRVRAEDELPADRAESG